VDSTLLVFMQASRSFMYEIAVASGTRSFVCADRNLYPRVPLSAMEINKYILHGPVRTDRQLPYKWCIFFLPHSGRHSTLVEGIRREVAPPKRPHLAGIVRYENTVPLWRIVVSQVYPAQRTRYKRRWTGTRAPENRTRQQG
jgi:hypothetical protein